MRGNPDDNDDDEAKQYKRSFKAELRDALTVVCCLFLAAFWAGQAAVPQDLSYFAKACLLAHFTLTFSAVTSSDGKTWATAVAATAQLVGGVSAGLLVG